MLFVNVLICSAIVFISYFFWNSYRKVFFIKRLDNVPGPKTLPLIGSFYHFLKNFEDFLEVLVNILQDYPSLCQVWIGSKPLIFISSPDIAKFVLNSKYCMDKASLYKLVSPWFGMGLATAPESVWNRMRTMTAPTFSSHMLQRFFNTFVEQSVALTDELEKVRLNENEILYGDHIATCTLRIACDALMGVQESNRNHLILKPIERGKQIIVQRLRNIHIYFFDTVFNLSAMGREQRKLLKAYHSVIDEMIQKSKDKLIQLNTTKDEKKQTYGTFLDIYMDACCKENFTQEEIRDNVSTILITGSDTITITCTFVVFMLANFPEIQDKAHQELLEIYGTETVKSAPVKYNDLQYMHYVDRVIKETLRLFPPAPFIGRKVTEDFKIGEVVIPKSADIFIPIIKLHRDEKYWPNPFVFDPDRFLPERIKDCHAFSYFPFSDGPRNCIGIKYGMMCTKVIVATLIRTFIFKVNKSVELDKIKLILDATLSSAEPFKVKIEKRYFP